MHIILFEDDPAADPAIRARLMPDHLAFLASHAAKVLAAGPLRDAAGRGAGGLWLVDGLIHADIETLIRADPFWPTGLRKSWRVLEWRQVFADGKPRL